MFYVDLQPDEDANEEDVITRSIKEIHQSAQKLSDNIERLSNDRDKFTNHENTLSYSSSDAMSASTETVIEGGLVPLPSFDSNGRNLSEETRSDTLQSNVTMEGDFDTPPETPDFPSSGSTSLNSTLSRDNFEINQENSVAVAEIHDLDRSNMQITMSEDLIEISESSSITQGDNSLELDLNHESPPKPPPRPKRKNRMKVKNLQLHGQTNSLDENSHQNDIFFRTDSASELRKETTLKGHINILAVSAGGLRQQWKPRWAVHESSACKLRLYKSEQEEEVVGEVDIVGGTFVYDAGDVNGQFKICTTDDEQAIDVGSAENRLYWLQQLQRARREFNQTSSNGQKNPGRSTQLGLLKERNEGEESKESSPFKDILATMERPPDLPPSRSADYHTTKKSFFQNFTRKPSFKQLVRSSSDGTAPPGAEPRSPPHSNKASSPTNSPGGFHALSKIRQSLREKKPPLGAGRRGAEDIAQELDGVRADLQASQDESSASKEVIQVLRKELLALQKEKETLSAMQPQLAEGQLVEILQDKDKVIVGLETDLRDKQQGEDSQNEQIGKLEQQVTCYQHMINVKDESIVKLTNQLHEVELAAKIDQASPPVMAGGGFFYTEKVTLGTQTEVDRLQEGLQDTVTAYEMQNKFLNKEVLELNQLRQQAIDREQKLFLESSDWEAQFYKIQSKYLLLLNELHNPQVMVSASRQEMVGHLLKDIVESSEKPSLNSQNGYDQFGFKQEDFNQHGESLEVKAERLRKIAQENHEETVSQLTSKEVEARWEGVVSTLGKAGHFTVTTDMKCLIRNGIPINQRGVVWKAIVDNRIRGVMDRPQPDYYKALLSNYNPGLALTPAAKQIELDLLRTLPSNKHYDSPHASGIPKLRRVLLAYSIHNPETEYCQGFNRIAAIALLFMNEEDAFWALVYIVEVVMPQMYYSKQMVGAQVDQAVFKELVCEKLPDLSSHLDAHGVDPALFSLNWFLCLFVDTLPVSTYLHIWDAFLFEGSKVLFRYALAILKSIEGKIMRQNDYMSIFNTFRVEIEALSDVRSLTQIAFYELNPFPQRMISNKREHHQKVLKAQMESLEVIRRDYRKNSMNNANATSPCYVQSDEEEG